MILRPVKPASPWGPPITNRPEGWICQQLHGQHPFEQKAVIANVIDSALVTEMRGDDLLDDLFQDFLPQVLGGDIIGVLGRNDDGVDSDGGDCTTVALVLDGHLGLGVRSKPGEGFGSSGHGERLVEFVGENDGKGHQFFGFGCGVSEHETLITGTMVFEGTMVKTLGDIGGLLLNRDENVAGLVVKTLVGMVVSDVLDGVSDDLLVVDLGLGRDFAKDHDHSGLGSGLAGDLGGRVLLQAGIELRQG
jgi:hypothetical protein